MAAVEPAVSELSQATTGSQELLVCGLCIKSISSKSAVKCATCQISCHVSCIVTKFVASGGKECKHSKEWLGEFLNAGPFHYSCSTCLVKNPNKSPGDISALSTVTNIEAQHGSDVALLRQEVAGMKSSFTAMSGDMNQMMKRLSELQNSLSLCAMPVSSSKTKQVEDKPLTFADAVSSNLVKAVVVEALREQRLVTSKDTNVVVHGFPEEDRDLTQIHEMLQFLGCSCSVVRCSRIGRPIYHATRPRPIKVELKSSSDTSMLLSSTRHLKHDDYYSGVFITKWMTREEVDELNKLRKRCASLNIKHPGPNGRKQFVVISGVLHERDSSGKLMPMKPVVPANGLSSSNVYAVKDSTAEATKISSQNPSSLVTSKKRLARESGDSPAAIFSAAAKPTSVDPASILLRNRLTDELLAARHLAAVDVEGVGNCMYRSLSIALYGSELQHAQLRLYFKIILSTNLRKPVIRLNRLTSMRLPAQSLFKMKD